MEHTRNQNESTYTDQQAPRSTDRGAELLRGMQEAQESRYRSGTETTQER